MNGLAKIFGALAFGSALAVLLLGGDASAQSFNLKKKKAKVEGHSLAFADTSHLPKLDVIIPVFDPNIPYKDDPEIWPEVRRAEANRFAWMLKSALEKSNAFGAIRVTPDDSGFGELYVHGEIVKANGEDIHLKISVNDIRGPKKKLMRTKTFKHRVQERFHTSARTRGTDAYAPIFDQIAVAIVAKLAKKKKKYFKDLKGITEMRFANLFGSDYFAEFVKEKRGTYKLVGMPAENDPVYAKIRAMRIQEQLFVDQLQPHYATFVAEMNPHYYDWQEYALPVSKKIRKDREARNLSIGLAVLGTVVGVAAKDNTVQTVGLATAALATLNAVREGGQVGEGVEVLNQMGGKLNLDLGPQVVEFEGIQTQLQGDAVDQFYAYRRHLLKIYESEYTPEVAL